MKSNLKKQNLKRQSLVLNRYGQGLVEYLILVAVIGVASIVMATLLQQTIKGKFSSIIEALQGKEQTRVEVTPTERQLERKDMSDFFDDTNKE